MLYENIHCKYRHPIIRSYVDLNEKNTILVAIVECLHLTGLFDDNRAELYHLEKLEEGLCCYLPHHISL